MNFPLIHTGRRFFFFSFVVEGRRAILSQLVRGAKRPLLTPLGERVVALWRQLHEIEPCFTASDFVIMPDHAHLLLIVNSAGEFRFNPLVFAHWFMECTANDAGLRPPNPCRWDIPAPQGFGGDAPVGRDAAQTAITWSRDYWIDISFERSQITPFKITRNGCIAMNERIAQLLSQLLTLNHPPKNML